MALFSTLPSIPIFPSSHLASPDLVTGDAMVVPSETELRHFPQTRDPVQDHSPQGFSLRGDAGGLGAVSSSQPRPATR